MFFKAIEIDPGYARAYAGIAECDALLWMSGATDISYQEILRNSTTALTFMPNLAEAHASKGLALFLSGHAEEAMTAFERAIELDPELFEAHEWYGEVCRNTGQFAKAAALFERAGELRPADYISLMLLRDCLGSLGFHEKSVDAARRAFIRIETQLMRRPNDAMAICTGAATLVSLGENQRAEEWAGRALAISPEDYLVHYNAACTYAVTGKLRCRSRTSRTCLLPYSEGAILVAGDCKTRCPARLTTRPPRISEFRDASGDRCFGAIGQGSGGNSAIKVSILARTTPKRRLGLSIVQVCLEAS